MTSEDYERSHLSVNKVFKKGVVLQFTESKQAWKLSSMSDLGLDHGPEKKDINITGIADEIWIRSVDYSIVSALYFLALIIVVQLCRRVSLV